MEVKNLGWVNSWYDNEPEEYKRCREAKHKLIVTDDYIRCLHHYHCEICGIVWHVDSGD